MVATYRAMMLTSDCASKARGGGGTLARDHKEEEDRSTTVVY